MSLHAKATSEYSETFDGILVKSELARKANFESSVAFVRSVIEDARRHRQVPGSEIIPPNLRIGDSLGMRSFRAALSDQTLGDIVRREASGWGPLRIDALTSGYSGAFMLALTSDSGESSVILKVARNEEVIADELRAQKDHFPELAPFGVRFVLIEAELQRLHEGTESTTGRCPCGGARSFSIVSRVRPG